MNKFWKITSIIAVLVAVVAIAGVTATFAQGPNQPDGFTPLEQNGSGNGQGLMAVDEADMHAAIAAALGMTVPDFEAAVAAGATPATLAQELGVDIADVLAAMDAVHTAALQQAVADSLITQEQADWMLSHRGGQNGRGNGMDRGQGSQRGQGNQGAGRMGRGSGNNGTPSGDCLYQTS